MTNINITILGQQYTIACPDGKEDNLQNTVNTFTEKLDVIKKNSNNLRSEQLIIMTALNVCHELIEEKEKNKKQIKTINNRIEDLSTKYRLK